MPDYRVHIVDPNHAESVLNKDADDGWTLVAVAPVGDDHALYFVKDHVPEDQGDEIARKFSEAGRPRR